MNKYYLKTYGCAMNHSDSERLKNVIENLAYQETSQIKEADLVVLNTCSVRKSAEDRVYSQLNKLAVQKKSKPNTKVILTGCMIQDSKDRLEKKLPQVDLFLKIKELSSLPNFISQQNNQFDTSSYLEIEPKSTKNFQRLIPIISGCNNFCTYCVVPYARDREFSRSIESVLEETRRAVESGVKEIWYLGQIVNRFAPKNSAKGYSRYTHPLAVLFEKVNSIPGDFRIYYTSNHPNQFSDDLIQAMSELPKIMPYLHLPLQSGSNNILRKMNRKYQVTDYLSVINKTKQIIPDICLATDILLGFCDEKEEDFQNTLDVFKECDFSMAYLNQYSERPGTAAALSFADNVPKQDKKLREKKLNDVLEQQSLKFNQRFMNKTVRVLVDSSHGNFLVGKSDHQRTVRIASKNTDLIGHFITVEIKEAQAWGLLGIMNS